MSESITQEQMEKIFERFFGSSGKENPAQKVANESIEEFSNRIKESTKSMKQSISVSKTIMAVADGQKQGMVDASAAMQQLDNELKALEKSLGTIDTAAKKEQLDAKKAAINGAKIEIAKESAIKNATGAVANFAIASIEIAASLALASLDFQKSLLGGGSGIEIAGQASMTLAKAEGDAAVATANFTREIGSSISALGGLATIPGPIGMIGKVAAVAGAGLEIFGAVTAATAKKLSEFEQKRLDTLKTALESQRKSYMDITSSGIILAGGMTQMRSDATRAGLTVDQFAKALKDSKDDLVFLGLGFGEASRRLSKVGAAIKNAGVDTQLLKLGYSFEEQASLAASMMANQKAAGDYRVRSDAEVARETLAYGKSLKILSDLTGKDAKKAAEKARGDAMRLEVSSKLTADQNQRFQAVLRNMPEELQKGFIEKILTGGTVVDQNTNILLATNKQAGEYLDGAMDNVMNSSKTADQVAQDTLAAGGKLGESLRNMDSSINTAGALAGGLAGQFGEFTNKLILHTNYTEGAANKVKENADKSADNQAALDKNVAALEVGVQKLKTALQDDLTKAITGFALEALAAARTMSSIAGATMAVTEGMWDKVKRIGGAAAVGAATGGVTGAMWGSMGGTAVLPGIGTVAGAGGGAAAGAIVGGVIAGVKEAFFNEKGKAAGGISTGPNTGYLEKLHGTEAVVPLDGGRTIPVSLDMSGSNSSLMSATKNGGATDLSSLLQEQIVLMKQFIDTTTQQMGYIQESKDIQQKLLHSSY